MPAAAPVDDAQRSIFCCSCSAGATAVPFLRLHHGTCVRKSKSWIARQSRHDAIVLRGLRGILDLRVWSACASHSSPRGEQKDEYQSQSSDSLRNDWPLFALARMDQQSLMTCLLPVLIPLTWVRSFKDLACTSTIGNVIFILAVLAVLHDGLQRFGPPALSDFASEGGVLRLWPESASSFALFFSPCIYLFTVHYCALPIEAEGPTVVSTAITSHSGGGGGNISGARRFVQHTNHTPTAPLPPAATAALPATSITNTMTEKTPLVTPKDGPDSWCWRFCCPPAFASKTQHPPPPPQ